MMRVTWSDDAVDDIINIKHYLLDNWGEAVADNFVNVVERKVILLSQFPSIGRPSMRENAVRKVSITKRHLLYYRVKRSEIEIAGIFDLKQSPQSNKFE